MEIKDYNPSGSVIKLEKTEIEPKLNTPQEFRASKDSISFVVNITVADTGAATATTYGEFFIAPFPCTLIAAYERHAAAGSSAGSVTLNIVKCADGVAKGSGISMIESTFDLKATVDTYQMRLPSETVTSGSLNKSLAAGQAMALQTSGTLTNVNEVCVTVVLRTDISNLPI